MIVKFFDDLKFKNKLSFYRMGDYMTIKNYFFQKKEHGHLE